MRIVVTALVAVVLTALAAPPPAVAQAAERLAFSTCVAAAQPHVSAAVVEMENVGGPRADPHLDAALAAAPDCPLVRALHAQGHSRWNQAERLRELDRAVAAAATASTAELLAVLALREWRRGATPVRDPLLEAAAQATPDDPFFALMRVFGTPDQAERIPLLRAILERFPEHAGSQNILGYALQRTGRTAEGLEAIARYVALLPDHPNSHDSHAELLQLDGRLDEAERSYRRAVEIDPDYDQGYAGLAEVAQLRGDHAAAARHLERALERARTPGARIGHLRALAFNAAVAGAFDDVRRWLRASVDEAESAGNAVAARTSRWYLAFLEAAEGNAELARKEWAAARAADDPYAGLGDAYVHAALGDAAAARQGLAELERAAATNGSVNPDAVALARLIAAAARGDLADARTRLDEIRGPGFRVIGQAYLARAHRVAGDAEGERLAMAEVEGYRQLDMAAAYARRLARQR